MVGPVKLFEFSAEEAISKTLVKSCSHQAFVASQEIQVSITGASKTEKLADINYVHRHAWDIDIQMGIVSYLEGGSLVYHTGT